MVVQKEEVAEVKWVSVKEMLELIEKGEMVASINLYLDLFVKLLKKYTRLTVEYLLLKVQTFSCTYKK